MIWEILGGFLVGYLCATIGESFFHQHILHASPRLVRLYSCIPWLGCHLLAARLSHHTIHHYATYKTNFVTQFESKDEREALTRKLREMGYQHIVERDFGNRLGRRLTDTLKYTAPSLIPFLAISLYFGPLFFLAGLPAIIFWCFVTEYIHSYLHKPYTDALAAAPIYLKWFLRTRYFKALSRYHRLHHKYPDFNFNLLLGGDVLRGKYKRENETDRQEALAMGLHPGSSP